MATQTFVFCVLMFSSISQGDVEESKQAGETITNTELGFRFSPPMGFRETAIDESDRDCLLLLMDREDKPNELPTVIRIQRLRTEIDPNERLSASELPKPKGMTASWVEAKWSGRPIEVMRLVSAGQPVQTVLYSVQFPLAGEAVAMQVGGPEDRDQETFELFQQSLAAFEHTRALAKPKVENEELAEGDGMDTLEKLFRIGPALSLIGIVIAAILIMRNLSQQKQIKSNDN